MSAGGSSRDDGASTPVDALAALRRATRDGHARIEDLLRLTEPMPLARYAEIVSGFATWLQAWEPRLRDAFPARLQPWFDARRRAALAAADVAWLASARAVVPRLDGSATARTLPLHDLDDALGSLYVIEGSALGARVIAPRLQASLGLALHQGASYFHGFGAEGPALWRDFRERVADEIATPDDVARTCASAVRTFDALARTFEPIADPPRSI